MTARVIVIEITRTYLAAFDGEPTDDDLYQFEDDPVDEEIAWHEPDPAETKAYADDIAYLLEEDGSEDGPA